MELAFVAGIKFLLHSATLEQWFSKTAVAAQRNLLEMQNLGSLPRPTGSETLIGPRSLCLTNSTGNPYSHGSWNAIATEGKL